MKASELPENAIRRLKEATLMALAAILLLLVGCQGLVKTRDIQVTSITWVRALPKDCGGQGNFAGCAEWSPGHCKITMPEDAPDWVVAHEFRHCFGYSHGPSGPF